MYDKQYINRKLLVNVVFDKYILLATFFFYKRLWAGKSPNNGGLHCLIEFIRYQIKCHGKTKISAQGQSTKISASKVGVAKYINGFHMHF